jgi:hypothetical protein
MSDGELSRLEVLRDLDQQRLTMAAAAQLLGLVFGLLKAYRAEGAAGLISKRRGRRSNRRPAAAVRAAALWIVRQNYVDFGPTLAAEKLAAEHGFSFSSETLRKWMITGPGAATCSWRRRGSPDPRAGSRVRHKNAPMTGATGAVALMIGLALRTRPPIWARGFAD